MRMLVVVRSALLSVTLLFVVMRLRPLSLSPARLVALSHKDPIPAGGGLLVLQVNDAGLLFVFVLPSLRPVFFCAVVSRLVGLSRSVERLHTTRWAYASPTANHAGLR